MRRELLDLFIYQIRLQTKLKSQSIGSDFGFNVMSLPMSANENSLVSPYDMLLMVNHMKGILNLLKPGVTAMTGKILYYVEKKKNTIPRCSSKQTQRNKMSVTFMKEEINTNIPLQV